MKGTPPITLSSDKLDDMASLAARMSQRRQLSEAETGAKQEALEKMDLLRTELLRSMEILYGVRALFEAKPEVTRAEFRRYVASALERNPELQALEWIPEVAQADRQAYEEAARADGLAAFTFTEINEVDQIVPATERTSYRPVYYAEPLQPNHPVLGLDLNADPRRREALERAALTGFPTSTSPLKLAQITHNQLGFLVVLAVHRPEDERLQGFCLAVFHVERLVKATFAPLVQHGIHIEIRDLTADGVTIFQTGEWIEGEAKWVYEPELPLIGRLWKFRFRPDKRFSYFDPDWLHRAAETLQRTNEILEERVAERTLQLAALNEALSTEVAIRQKAEGEAEAANKAKSRFLADMSHEIRTPLNVVLGYTQLLQRDTTLAPRHMEAVRAIVEGGNHLLCLVDSVLDLSKIESGRMELALVDFDFNQLLQGLAAMFGPRCAQKGLRFRLERLKNGPHWVNGDEQKLRQVLINLLGNAVKFTDSGEIRLRVVPTGNADTYRLEVIDTGPGIPTDSQKMIFEPFRQESSGIMKGGSGLGLSIALKLIELMGGGLTLYSRPGWGSNFTFSLTLSPAKNAVAVSAHTSWTAARLEPDCEIKTLIVTEETPDKTMLDRLLCSLGCTVELVPRYANVSEIAQRFQPHVVFLDSTLAKAETGGIPEQLSLIKSAPHICLYSGAVFQHERKQIPFEYSFLAKPFRIEQITAILARLPNARFVASTPTPPSPQINSEGLSSDQKAMLLGALEIGDYGAIRQLCLTYSENPESPQALLKTLIQHTDRYDGTALSAALENLPESTPAP